MSELYDVAILGAGPAGITAAVYAARARLRVLWLDKGFMPGGQINDTYEVDNYPGLFGLSGADLGEAMAKHAQKFGMAPLRANITEIEDLGEEKVIRTRKAEYRARTIVAALGASHRKLGIPGEEELAGMGVSYCATCDGAFFKDRTVAVIGGGNTAVEDALFLAKICKKVYLVHRRDILRADRILQEHVLSCPNVEILWDCVPVEIMGEEQVTGVTIKNVRQGEETRLFVDGVFVAVGVLPNTGLLQGLAELDESGYVRAGEDCATSAPGVFAAGDIRTKVLRQVVTAAADGANSITAVQRWLRGER
jgi:thioredoxin reductase (NADPH)